MQQSFGRPCLGNDHLRRATVLPDNLHDVLLYCMCVYCYMFATEGGHATGQVGCVPITPLVSTLWQRLRDLAST